MKKLLIALLMIASQLAFAATELTAENYEALLTKSINSGRPAVIKFYADWCGPCQLMKPVYEAVEKDLAGKADFYTINVEGTNPLARVVNSIPTIVVLKSKGQQVEPIVGYMDKDQLEKAILERMK
jgi:thioredoxin 1